MHKAACSCSIMWLCLRPYLLLPPGYFPVLVLRLALCGNTLVREG